MDHAALVLHCLHRTTVTWPEEEEDNDDDDDDDDGKHYRVRGFGFAGKIEIRVH
jgi:hypothetical protein